MAELKKRKGESIDSLLRKFKRQVKNEGTLQQLKMREHFEKPSEEKKRLQKAAERRTRNQQLKDEF